VNKLVRKKNFVEDAIRKLSGYLEKSKRNEAERIKHYEEKLRQLERLREIRAKRLRGDGLSWEDVEEAMKVTCYGSLAYCCGLEKRCPYSFAVMDALGLSPARFAKFKEDAVNEYIATQLRMKEEPVAEAKK